MQSRLLLNLFLLFVVAALSIYLFVSQEDEQTTANQLTQLSIEAIDHIKIRHNERTIDLVKTDGEWQMVSPIKIIANTFRINMLLKLLNTVSYADYSAGELDLEKYGLAPAATSIKLNDTTIDFGITNPINGQRYVLTNNTVHLIDDNFYPLLSSQVGALAARELIPASAVITQLVLPEDTLKKDENGAWQSSKDISADAINDVLYEWQHAQAFGIHNYMQRDSLGKIEVYLADSNDPVRFYITDTDPWLIIARPDLDIEYHFNLEFYDRLLRPGADPRLPDEFSEQQPDA